MDLPLRNLDGGRGVIQPYQFAQTDGRYQRCVEGAQQGDTGIERRQLRQRIVAIESLGQKIATA